MRILKEKPVRADDMEDVMESDIVQLSRALLEAMVDSTNLLDIKEMTPQKLRESKAVLGYLNAARNALGTRMQIFKLTGLDKKLDVIRERGKKI